MSGTAVLYLAGLVLSCVLLASAALVRRQSRLDPVSRVPGQAAIAVRLAVVAISAALVVVGCLELAIGIGSFGWAATPGIDFDIYRQAADRFVHGGSWFLDHQVHGPYAMTLGDVLYPSSAAVLLVPFQVLPGILWWLIPLTTTAGVVLWLRPAAWSWPLILLGLVWPLTLARILTGNPAMWLVMLVALGVVFEWPSAMVAVKPTLVPFALVGARRRAWWVVLGVLALVTLLLPEGLAYVSVLRDAKIGEGWLYGVVDWPSMSIPIVASLARTDGRSTGRSGSATA